MHTVTAPLSLQLSTFNLPSQDCVCDRSASSGVGQSSIHRSFHRSLGWGRRWYCNPERAQPGEGRADLEHTWAREIAEAPAVRSSASSGVAPSIGPLIRYSSASPIQRVCECSTSCSRAASSSSGASPIRRLVRCALSLAPDTTPVAPVRHRRGGRANVAPEPRASGGGPPAMLAAISFARSVTSAHLMRRAINGPSAKGEPTARAR
jgi:hypothetical protein